MITLLMALFMVLYAMSLVDRTKFEELRVSLHDTFSSAIASGGTSILDRGGAVSPGAGSAPSSPAVSTPLAGGALAVPLPGPALRRAEHAAVSQQARLVAAQQDVLAALRRAHVAPGRASVTVDERGLVVSLATDRVLFALGSDSLSARARPLLAAVARALQPLPNAVSVEGWTDALPYHGRFGNGGLAAARALVVLDALRAHGFDVASHHAVAVSHGSAGAPPGRPAPARRRVEIVVERSAAGGVPPAVAAAHAGPLGAGPLSPG
jgi:chemotaxis protein MotB